MSLSVCLSQCLYICLCITVCIYVCVSALHALYECFMFVVDVLQVFYKYCLNATFSAQMLYGRYYVVHIMLYKYCTRTGSIHVLYMLYKRSVCCSHCACSVQVLYMCCVHVVHMLYTCCMCGQRRRRMTLLRWT